MFNRFFFYVGDGVIHIPLADIAFIKLCKKEQLIPTFAKVSVSIRNGTYKLKRKIARLVMETKL